MNSIDHIKTLIDQAGGLQRSNRYNVVFYSPASDANNTIPAQKILFGGREIVAVSDKLPGPDIGRMIPAGIGYGKDDASLLITFPVEQNWNTYKIIENWMNTLVNDGSNPDFFYGPTFARPYDEWARFGTVWIECLDMNGDIKSTFIFREAYPIKIQPITMQADISNQFLTFDVLFNFRTYSVR
jgi:hypothetical protein